MMMVAGSHKSNLNPPIFIVGAPRSGTTLLTQMLSMHPDIFIYNETLFYDFVSAKELHGKLTDSKRRELVQHLSSRIDARIKDNEGQTEFGCRFTDSEAVDIKSAFLIKVESYEAPISAEKIFEIFMMVVASCKGRKIWGDKTPNHVFHLDKISRDFPTAKIIHVVRDPRDFLISYKYSWRQKGSRKEVAKLYNPLVTSFLWKRSENALSNFLDKSGSDAVMIVRFESLVDNPEKVMTEVMQFLCMSYHQSVDSVSGGNSSFSGSKEELSGLEKAVCEYVCRREMKLHGYEKSVNSAVGFINFVLSLFTLPLFAWRAIPVVRAHFKGGFFTYLKSRGILSKSK